MFGFTGSNPYPIATIGLQKTAGTMSTISTKTLKKTMTTDSFPDSISFKQLSEHLEQAVSTSDPIKRAESIRDELLALFKELTNLPVDISLDHQHNIIMSEMSIQQLEFFPS